MTSTSETGHAKNVANFQDLIEFATGYGATYAPSKVSLQVPKLIAIHTTAENSLTNVIAKNTAFNNKVNERYNAFSNIKPWSTRLLNALQATDASKETIDDAKGFNRKIQGKRASKIPVQQVDPNTPAPTTISASQQSYDQLIQHLAGLNEVLSTEVTYTPNETDLQTAYVLTVITDLTAKNTAVATAYTNVSNSRIERNDVLYTNEDNLVEIANEVKKYIKSVFGASSPQYQQVSGLKFTKPKL